MRCLIVRLGAFGDIIHTLPLAADLAAAGHQVDWLCEDRWGSLLAGSPAVGRLHLLPRRRLRGAAAGLRLNALRLLVRQVRRARYDAVIDAQGLAKSALLAAASGAPLRLGHRRPRARELSWIIGRIRTPATAEHVIDQQRALGLPLTRGVGGGWRFPLPAWAAERAAMRAWLARQGLAGAWALNVGAGWPSKVWPEERQKEFARALKKRGQALLLLWGSPAEQALATAVARTHGIVAPATTLPELGGLLPHLGVMVSGDTGPLHLAHALGVPTVGLFGPVPGARNGPRGRGARILQAPGDAWERKDPAKGRMGEITAAMAVAAAEAALADQPPPPQICTAQATPERNAR
jgi:heptosyltransferase-1